MHCQTKRWSFILLFPYISLLAMKSKIRPTILNRKDPPHYSNTNCWFLFDDINYWCFLTSNNGLVEVLEWPSDPCWEPLANYPFIIIEKNIGLSNLLPSFACHLLGLASSFNSHKVSCMKVYSSPWILSHVVNKIFVVTTLSIKTWSLKSQSWLIIIYISPRQLAIPFSFVILQL
jgi:hypothetical protein